MKHCGRCLDLKGTWKTTIQENHAGATWWKKPLHEVCPHGLQIVIVNGSHVRNSLDSDFDQGGNGYRYPFIPKKELWIDDSVPHAERPYVAFHECHESEDMKHGKGYDKAHDAAKALEDKARKRNRPGERRR